MKYILENKEQIKNIYLINNTTLITESAVSTTISIRHRHEKDIEAIWNISLD